MLTDGHTWAHTVDDLLGSGARISAILVGESSLDVNIANLCAMTGGQLFYAPQADVASAVESALETLRLEGLAVSGTPEKLLCIRAGIEMTATVSKETAAGSLDPIGRYAAALSLPLLASEEAQFYAVKHGLCGHFTSPVLVDEAGSMVAGLPEMRKVELMAARSRCAPESPQFHRSPQSEVAFLKSLPTVTADRCSPAEPVVTPTNKGKGPLTWLQAVVRGNGGRQRQGRLANCARSIDWDNQANLLLSSSLDGLDPQDRLTIRQLAERPEIIKLAATLGVAPQLAAIAVIACHAPDNRNAERVVRKLLAGRSNVEMDRTISALAESPGR